MHSLTESCVVVHGVLCISADFHFCWLCKKPWAGHGSYYECTTYKADVEKGQYSDEEKKVLFSVDP